MRSFAIKPQYETAARLNIVCDTICLQSDTDVPAAEEDPTTESSSESSGAEDNEGTDQDEEEPEDVLELCSTMVPVKGSTYHGHQGVLQRLKGLGNNMFDVPVGLQPEPSNPVDRNAVKITCSLGVSSEAIGYIGVHDLPMVHVAMKGDLITREAISLITGRYNVPAKQMIYSCKIAITKKGKWPHRDMKNTHNSDL